MAEMLEGVEVEVEVLVIEMDRLWGALEQTKEVVEEEQEAGEQKKGDLALKEEAAVLEEPVQMVSSFQEAAEASFQRAEGVLSSRLKISV
jgi:hypothetical protein